MSNMSTVWVNDGHVKLLAGGRLIQCFKRANFSLS